MQTLYILLILAFVSCGKNQSEQSIQQKIKQKHELTLQNIKLINFENSDLENIRIDDFRFQLISNSNYYLENNYTTKELPFLPIQIKGPFQINSNKSVTILDYPDFEPEYNLSWLHFAKNQSEPLALNLSFKLNLVGKSLYNLKKIKLLLILNDLTLQQIEINDPAQQMHQMIAINHQQMKVSELFKINQPDFKLKLLITDLEYYIEKEKNDANHYTVINSSPLTIIHSNREKELKETLKLADPNVQLDEANNILGLFNIFSNQIRWKIVQDNNISMIHHEQTLERLPDHIAKQNNQEAKSPIFFIPLEMDLELRMTAYNETYQTYTTNEFIPYDSPRQGDGRGRAKSLQDCNRTRAHLANTVTIDQNINFEEIKGNLELCSFDKCQSLSNFSHLLGPKHLNLTVKSLPAGQYFFRWQHNPHGPKIALDYISQYGSHCRGVASKRFIDAYKLQQLKIDYLWKNFEK